MAPKIKNALIFVGIAAVLILAYVFFVRGGEDGAALVSSSTESTPVTSTTPEVGSAIAQDFLSILLNIKSIRLNDAIFSDPAFLTLRDSSIVLFPDGNEGRPNPFAAIGSDIIATPPSALPGMESPTDPI